MVGALPPRFSEIEHRAREAALRADNPASAASAAIAEAEAFFADIATQPAIKSRLDGLACAKGCDSCCHQMVGVTGAEAALLAKAVAALPGPRRKAVIARVHAIAARSAAMGPAEWWAARLPCPLLENGLCVVHDARPLPCRAMNSADARACADANRIPILAAQHGVFGHAQAGLAQATGTGAKGLATALAELVS